MIDLVARDAGENIDGFRAEGVEVEVAKPRAVARARRNFVSG